MTQDNLFSCVLRSWSPGFGDPTLLGWATTAGYLISGMLAFVVMKREEAYPERFWLWLSLFLLTIGINKQLDLQSAVLAGARCIASAQGWYGNHYSIKYAIFAALSILILFLISILFLFYKRNQRRRIGGPILGLVFIMIYIALRATVEQSYLKIDDEYTLLFRSIWIIEILGISLILIGTIDYVNYATRTSLSEDNQP